MEKKQKATCCSIENCEGKGRKTKNGTIVFSKGYCVAHYCKFRKYGNPLEVKTVYGEERHKHPLYRTYLNMKCRCCNTNNPAFQNYGGRGITVCEQWLGKHGFSQFCTDMGDRPEGCTLDRIRVNEGYSKSNCRWATHCQQSANKRNNNEVVGVNWNKKMEKWQVRITIDRKRINLGLFASHELAAQARREAEEKYNIYSENKSIYANFA